jgi:solute carrier family 25 carnitine/acylcarnitine transporter 20/29
MQSMRVFNTLLLLLLSICASGFKSAERGLSPTGSVRTALGSSTTGKVAVVSLVAAVAPVTQGAVNALASLCAGSIAGACGVGIGYPLDSLKVRAQSLSAASGNRLGLIGMCKLIYRKEGISGFYSGVGGSMFGQALIAAAAFSSNNFAKGLLTKGRSVQSATLVELALAASFGGLVTSFLTNPIERVKVIMQSSGTNASYLSCLISVLKVDGLFGLLFRGMEATMWREIPGYALYFWVYELLKRSALARLLGPSTPLICGGLAGMISWMPVYPFDVLKTNM